MEYKNPFSFYDFLGYFIPGALFFYLFVLAFGAKVGDWIGLDFLQGLSLFEQSIAFIIVSYVLGHIVNYLSTITIERYSIWSIGYPSKYIFGILPKGYFKTLDNLNDEEEKKRRKYELKISKRWRLTLFCIIAPLSIIDYIIGKKMGFRLHYTNQVGSPLKEIITERMEQFKKKYNYDVKNKDSGDFFRIIWHFYYEKYKAHAVKLDNYVALYGFTRSMSFIFCMYCWLFMFSIPFRAESWLFYVIASVICAGLSFVFYIAFLKFYRRFTLEGFMCLTIDTELEKTNNKLK
jgi:hypothetical protein